MPVDPRRNSQSLTHLLKVWLSAALVQLEHRQKSINPFGAGIPVFWPSSASQPIGPWIYEISNTLTQIVVLPHRPFDE